MKRHVKITVTLLFALLLFGSAAYATRSTPTGAEQEFIDYLTDCLNDIFEVNDSVDLNSQASIDRALEQLRGIREDIQDIEIPSEHYAYWDVIQYATLQAVAKNIETFQTLDLEANECEMQYLNITQFLLDNYSEFTAVDSQ